MRTGITGAKWIHAVEGALRASVPKIAIVEYRVNHWRSVARRGAANVDGAVSTVGDAPDGIDDAGFVFRGLAQHHVIKVVPEHTLRADNVVVVAVQSVQREITESQAVVWSK